MSQHARTGWRMDITTLRSLCLVATFCWKIVVQSQNDCSLPVMNTDSGEKQFATCAMDAASSSSNVGKSAFSSMPVPCLGGLNGSITSWESNSESKSNELSRSTSAQSLRSEGGADIENPNFKLFIETIECSRRVRPYAGAPRLSDLDRKEMGIPLAWSTTISIPKVPTRRSKISRPIDAIQVKEETNRIRAELESLNRKCFKLGNYAANLEDAIQQQEKLVILANGQDLRETVHLHSAHSKELRILHVGMSSSEMLEAIEKCLGGSPSLNSTARVGDASPRQYGKLFDRNLHLKSVKRNLTMSIAGIRASIQEHRQAVDQTLRQHDTFESAGEIQSLNTNEITTQLRNLMASVAKGLDELKEHNHKQVLEHEKLTQQRDGRIQDLLREKIELQKRIQIKRDA